MCRLESSDFLLEITIFIKFSRRRRTYGPRQVPKLPHKLIRKCARSTAEVQIAVMLGRKIEIEMNILFAGLEIELARPGTLPRSKIALGSVWEWSWGELKKIRDGCAPPGSVRNLVPPIYITCQMLKWICGGRPELDLV